MKKKLSFNISEGIAFLVLSNPPANPMTSAFFDELAEICENKIAPQNYKGLIIKSEGRHFSSGADIEELITLIRENSSNDLPDFAKKNIRSFRLLYTLKKPIISLLKGVCYGSALELALCADYRIAAPNTLLALPETSFNLMPGLGGINRLYNNIGFAKTAEMVLTAQSIFAEEALRIGLINTISHKNQMQREAIKKIDVLQKKIPFKAG